MLVYTSVLLLNVIVSGNMFKLNYYITGIMITVDTIICILSVVSMLSFLTGIWSAKKDTRKDTMIPLAVIAIGYMS